MNVNWLFNKCRRYEASLSLLAAGALDASERVAVETHLAGCPACRTTLAGLRKLTCSLESLGKCGPQVEPTIALRRRWQTAVRQSSRPATEPSWAWLSLWFSGRRAAWTGLAAMWVLVLLLRLSAADAPRPGVVATVPISLSRVLLALEVQNDRSKQPADVGSYLHQKKSRSDALPPRSQMRPVRPLDSEVACT
jgi:anti-sigma factor RsiW